MISKIPSNNFDGLFIELNFHKKKSLICYTYNAHKSNISNHLIYLGEKLDIPMSEYDNFLIVGDFNSEWSESAMSNFCETYQLHVFVKCFTCFKNPEKLSCIDLILKNCSKSCINKQTAETELSDFHKLMPLVLKMHYERPSPKIVTYRHYKMFLMKAFSQNFLMK